MQSLLITWQFSFFPALAVYLQRISYIVCNLFVTQEQFLQRYEPEGFLSQNVLL